jgi:hypothetical protein
MELMQKRNLGYLAVESLGFYKTLLYTRVLKAQKFYRRAEVEMGLAVD